MSEFKVACPNCDQHIAFDESYSGMQINCPKCGMSMELPAVDASPREASSNLNAPSGLRISRPAPAPAAPRAPQPARAPGRLPVAARPRGKSWLTTFMLAWFLGGLGIDRFYTGRTGLGIGKLLTNAACGAWGLVDVLLLLFKRYRDAEGNRLQPAKRSHYFIALSVVATTVLAGVVVAANLFHSVKSEVARAESTADRINCMNNLKQVGLAFRIWAGDHGDAYPFNVPAAKGGTREYSQREADGFDANAFRHFQVLSNELGDPKILICPGDTSKKPATDWKSLTPDNVSYRVRSGPQLSDRSPNEVLARCPLDGNTLYCDGSVRMGRRQNDDRSEGASK